MTIRARYAVKFVADYYVLTVTVDAFGHEEPEAVARDLLGEEYGLDPVTDHGAAVEVEPYWVDPQEWPKP